MAAVNKPAGIRALVYGIGKGKARIEGLSVSAQFAFEGIGHNCELGLGTSRCLALNHGAAHSGPSGLFSKSFCYLLIPCGALWVYASDLF